MTENTGQSLNVPTPLAAGVSASLNYLEGAGFVWFIFDFYPIFI